MEIEKTLKELDQLFATHQIGQAERFLKRKIAEEIGRASCRERV